MPVRSADAVWEGDVPSGKGTMRFGGGAFEGQYSFSSRFEEGTGTNPEELIAAAHAGCFSMFISGVLAKAGHTPTKVETTAKVRLEKVDDAWTVTRSDLVCEAAVPDIEDGAFQEAAEAAKKGCPISRLLNTEISLEAKLVG
ncbi:MAG: OsmC family protein [Actinomycetota bacterium]